MNPGLRGPFARQDHRGYNSYNNTVVFRGEGLNLNEVLNAVNELLVACKPYTLPYYLYTIKISVLFCILLNGTKEIFGSHTSVRIGNSELVLLMSGSVLMWESSADNGGLERFMGERLVRYVRPLP